MYEMNPKPLAEMELYVNASSRGRVLGVRVVHNENLSNQGVDRVGNFATMPDPAFRPLGDMQLSLTSEQLDSREDVRLS